MHELVWIKLNESKCTVKQWNLHSKSLNTVHTIQLVGRCKSQTCRTLEPWVRIRSGSEFITARRCISVIQSPRRRQQHFVTPDLKWDMVLEITLDTNESEQSPAMSSCEQGNDPSCSNTKTGGLPAKQRGSQRLNLTERIGWFLYAYSPPVQFRG